jgi:FMN phosphatase YigB (HAD superfamily)
MPSFRHVFLDFENTLVSQSELRRRYVEELAALLSSDFGGEPEVCLRAARTGIERSVARYEDRFLADPLAEFIAWLGDERERVGREVFHAASLPLPDEAIGEVVKRLQFDALSVCSAPLPGASEALDALFQLGFRVQLASAWDSEWLMAALMGSGLESYTESKFGPDLVNCAKEGPEFYRRIFAVCGVSPRETVVVDDQPKCLAWASEAGANVIQARIVEGTPCEYPYAAIHALDELAEAVAASIR